MSWLAFALTGIFIVALGLVARLAVHAGRIPGGVDTWYYLAYADAFRRRPSWDVRLPQYLLQDERQSYPPLFPSLLALLPTTWRRRGYWLISPLIDSAHLLLLYFVAAKLTASLPVAAIAAATYAITPHLVSETRNLSARPFGALVHSLALLILLKVTVSGGHWAWTVAAVGAGGVLFLSSAALAAAYGFVCGVLSLWFGDPRYVLLAAGGLAAAVVVSGGHMLRVIGNYLSAVSYWRRNHHAYGSHPVRDAPILGGRPRSALQPGFLGGTTPGQLLRLLGENPFLVALPLASATPGAWSARLYVWAVALASLAVIATVYPPLRAFGPGRSYMKAAIFPTAYTLAAAIGTPAGLVRPLGIVTLGCMGASVAAVVFFVLYVRGRDTEQTASLPAALVEATRILAGRPRTGVLVLPYMYADYVCYRSGQPVAWGGHCGDLGCFEWLAPIVTRPLAEILADLSIGHVLLDLRFVRAEELQVPGTPAAFWESGGFAIYECEPGPPAQWARSAGSVGAAN